MGLIIKQYIDAHLLNHNQKTLLIAEEPAYVATAHTHTDEQYTITKHKEYKI